MNKNKWEFVLNGLDDDILLEAVAGYDRAPRDRKDYDMNTTMPKRATRTLLIAAALALVLTVGVFAAGRLLNSPQQAWKAAQQEVEEWKALGLLVPEVTMPDQAAILMECPARDGGEYWYGRLFPHCYAVGCVNGKYNINLQVDTFTGKLFKFSIEAYADAGDTPVRTEAAPDGSVYEYYANYEDIVSPDMTVDRFCSLLAAYWGFSGYTLSGTQDAFYGYDAPAPRGDTLLTELDEEAYLTVYFDGDQSGAPMYVQLAQNAGSVYLTAGTNHLIG